nr:RNA-directed DNA polymerase, eukaryota, reverse transcriptase zinc-binding domain protein [Tanacetum cinerariifolium]
NLFEKVKRLKKNLNEAQIEIDKNPNNTQLMEHEVALLKEYTLALEDEENFLFQKAKFEWLNDGDRNSAFFHKVLKGRVNRSRVVKIMKFFVKGKLLRLNATLITLVLKDRTGKTSLRPLTYPMTQHQGLLLLMLMRADLEISNLKARIKLLEDKDKGSAEPSGDDDPIKARSLETGEEAGVERSTERGSNDTEEMVNVLTFMDAANIINSRVQDVSVPPTAEVSTVGVPTSSGLVPTVSVIFTTASVVKPNSRRKVAREMEEEMAREDQRMNEQIVRDAAIARIHAEKELKMLIDGLDRNNEVIAKYLQEYEQFAADLNIGEKIDLINELLDREDLNQLWNLVKETLSIRQASSDKEKELWVELKRLFEPDFEDQMWTHTQALMHDPLEWRLYDTCGVHHVFTRDQKIFMLVERDYPLR